jgi:hypothetical protein
MIKPPLKSLPVSLRDDFIILTKGVKEKRVTETYLVEALSVTEAEAKVIEDFKGVTFDFEVKSVTASKILKILE